MKRNTVLITFISIRHSNKLGTNEHFGSEQEAWNKFMQTEYYSPDTEYCVIQEMETGDWNIFEIL